MRRLVVFTVLAVLAASTAGLSGRAPVAFSQTQTLAIHSGRLFDGTGAPVIEDGVVLIEGTRIVAAGAAADVIVPDGAARIDANGGLIMPGVIDNHMHLEGGGRLVWEDYLTPWLKAGVTTLVSNGGLRDGGVVGDGIVIEDGVAFLRITVEGLSERPPRMLVSGPILTAPAGYPATRREPYSEQAAQFIDGPADAGSRVARLIDEQGVDFIKVAIEVGFDSDYGDAGWPVLDMETLTAIVEATHERGLTARAHVTQEGELGAALDAGFDVAAHTPLEPLSDEVLQRAAGAGMIFVSTANIWGSQRGEAVPDNLRRYTELGGRVALGTDFPFQVGSQMPVQEMQLLISGGLTPEQVLIAATRDSAAAVGRESDLGTLEPGKLADVIVVDGNPLNDISDMARVSTVILEGEIVVGNVIEAPQPASTRTPRLPDAGGAPPESGQVLWPFYVAAVIVLGGAVVGVGRLTTRRKIQ